MDSEQMGQIVVVLFFSFCSAVVFVPPVLRALFEEACLRNNLVWAERMFKMSSNVLLLQTYWNVIDNACSRGDVDTAKYCAAKIATARDRDNLAWMIKMFTYESVSAQCKKWLLQEFGADVGFEVKPRQRRMSM
jgi:hypothetical protein